MDKLIGVLPVITKTIELEAPFEGWQFEARINPKLRTVSKLSSGQTDKILEGLGELVIDWNFVDEEGNPLPPPGESDVMYDLTVDLAIKMADAIQVAITTVEGN